MQKSFRTITWHEPKYTALVLWGETAHAIYTVTASDDGFTAFRRDKNDGSVARTFRHGSAADAVAHLEAIARKLGDKPQPCDEPPRGKHLVAGSTRHERRQRAWGAHTLIAAQTPHGEA